MPPITQLLQFAANGLVLGSILTLTAVGLTLVYGILHLANFAHGDLITLGAYLGLFFTAFIPRSELTMWAIGVIAVVAVGLVVDRVLKRWFPDLGDGEGLGLRRIDASWGVYVVLIVGTVLAGMRWSVDLGGGWDLALPMLVAAGATLWSARRKLGDRSNRKAVAAGGAGALLIALLYLTVAPALAGRPPMDLGLVVTFGLLPVVTLGATLASTRARAMKLGLAVAVLVAAYLFGSVLLLGTVLAISTVVAVSMVLDLVLWRPLRHKEAGLLTLIIASIGLALALRNGVILQWGSDLQSYAGAPQRALPILGSGVSLTETQLIVIGISVLAIGIVHVLLRRTRVGKAMRALSDNMDLARITGIDVDRVILYVWAVAGGLAALSGVLLGQIRPIHPNLGWFLLLPIFAAVILGGIGSPYGAMAGGYAIGLAMETSPYFGVPSAYKPAVGFVILIVVLLIRPGGIFGQEATR